MNSCLKRRVFAQGSSNNLDYFSSTFKIFDIYMMHTSRFFFLSLFATRTNDVFVYEDIFLNNGRRLLSHIDDHE